MALPRYEKFSEYSRSEINKIKEEVCIAHHCPYAKRLQQQVRKSSVENATYCDYLCMTGHSRGCLPVDCTHYNDTGVKRRVAPISGDYIY